MRVQATEFPRTTGKVVNQGLVSSCIVAVARMRQTSREKDVIEQILQRPIHVARASESQASAIELMFCDRGDVHTSELTSKG